MADEKISAVSEEDIDILLEVLRRTEEVTNQEVLERRMEGVSLASESERGANYLYNLCEDPRVQGVMFRNSGRWDKVQIYQHDFRGPRFLSRYQPSSLGVYAVRNEGGVNLETNIQRWGAAVLLNTPLNNDGTVAINRQSKNKVYLGCYMPKDFDDFKREVSICIGKSIREGILGKEG